MSKFFEELTLFFTRTDLFRMRESLKKVLNSFEIHIIHADWMNHVINNGCLGCLDLDRAVHPCAVVIRDSKSPKNEWDLLH